MRVPDLDALPESYLAFAGELASVLPAGAIVSDPLRLFALGTDASFYRLTPKLAVAVKETEEVRALLRAAGKHRLPVTFRAAGTSLSGQAVSDSVLVLVSGGFTGREVLDGGKRVRLEPGVIGADANQLLLPYGRKLGPDPASIGACMVGGIVANNASGMCCGTAENSYQTVESMRLLLWDGFLLDTAVSESRKAFEYEHPEILSGLASIRDELRADRELSERVRRKYKIKNTTGYGLNAFLDHQDPIDILFHLMVGSEGTLGFIGEVTFRTVPEPAHKASALVLYPDIGAAAHAVEKLDRQVVAAAEIMDRASLRSVTGKPGMPKNLEGLSPTACALLVEVRAASVKELEAGVDAAVDRLRGVSTLEPVAFTAERAKADRLWDIRRGLYPAVGAARRVGTTVVIEDVAFPKEHLAEGTLALQDAFSRHGYEEGIIFGHALDGNLHFTFTQDFGDRREVARYRTFLDEVCGMVVDKFDGSLKAEHGTGRNMAPFVEREWGATATALMRRVKALFDPHGLLNPGVIIGDDKEGHLKNLKPLPIADDIIDRCIECGFCEPKCPSRNLTATPRQRITVAREISRLKASGEDPARLRRIESDFRYWGEETCATDGLCATLCPVGIDTGEYVKSLRAKAAGPLAQGIAGLAAHNLAFTSTLVRIGLSAAKALRVSPRGDRPPLPSPPRGAPYRNTVKDHGRQVVYLPACVARTFGPTTGDPDDRAQSDAVRSLLEKALYDVRFPKGLNSLCCGLAFSSKGFLELGDAKAKELEGSLLESSLGGEIPVLCDTSPCLQRMRKVLDPRLKLYEPVEFVHDHLLDKLTFKKEPGPIAVHLTCSSAKLGLKAKLEAVAQLCAEKVVVPAAIGCCGFAGDRGFTHPELNASALSGLAAALPKECHEGFSNSRTCELGLSFRSGRSYRSIVFLVDRCTKPAAV